MPTLCAPSLSPASTSAVENPELSQVQVCKSLHMKNVPKHLVIGSCNLQLNESVGQGKLLPLCHGIHRYCRLCHMRILLTVSWYIAVYAMVYCYAKSCDTNLDLDL